MALALGTSPAIKNSGFLGSSPESFASNTFSPAAGSVIVCLVFASQSYIAAWNAASITDSLATHLTWNLAASATDVTLAGQQGACWLFWASCPSSQTNMTVTPTVSVSGGQYIAFMDVAVKVYTGALTTGAVGATITGTSTSTSISPSITPTAIGSALGIMIARTVSTATANVAGTGMFVQDSQVVPAGPSASYSNIWQGTSATAPTLTSSTSPTTLPVSTTDTSNVWQYLGYEILAAVSGGQTVTGVVATAVGVAPTGTVSAGSSPAGVVATAVGVAPTGAVSAGAAPTGVVTTSVGVAPTGSVSAGSKATGVIATCVGVAPVGTASGSGTATVGGITATSVGTAPTGTVSGSSDTTGSVATSTGHAPAGAVAGSSSVAGVVTSSIGVAPTGSTFGSVTIAGLVAMSVGEAIAGIVTGGGVQRDITLIVGPLSSTRWQTGALTATRWRTGRTSSTRWRTQPLSN